MGKRRIPVTINGHRDQIVGLLVLSEQISDQDIFNTGINWVINTETNQLIEARLIPLPPANCDRCDGEGYQCSCERFCGAAACRSRIR